jgi:xylan 1,4-beta-xylosidase
MAYRWLVCLLMIGGLTALGSAAPKVGENLVANPGFEAPQDGLPAQWEHLAYGGHVAWDDAVAHSGKASVRVEDNGGVASGYIPYLGGPVTVSAWSKLQDVTCGPAPWNVAAIQVLPYDANRQILGHSDIMLEKGTRDWRRCEGTVRYGRDVAYVRVTCHIWDGEGTAWFDDVSLSYAQDPARLKRKPMDLARANVLVDCTMPLGPFRHLWIGTDLCYPDRIFHPINTRTYPYYREAGFRYMRIHNMVRANQVYQEDKDGRPVYDFTLLDRGLDRLKEEGFWPVFVIEGTPPQFATGDSGVDYCNPYPPKDFGKWYALVRAIVQHCKDRYGNDIRNWYWEVWNEPGPVDGDYYHGSLEDILKVYDYSVAAATSVDERIKIGGLGGAATEYTAALLRHCTRERNFATGKTGTPIDFVSWHLYTTGVGRPVFDELPAVLGAARDMLKPYQNLAKLPILITEWGAASSANTGHDRTFDAAFRAMCVRWFMDYGIELALPFCVADDCYAKGDAFHGDLGLFTHETIPKPGYQAFRLLQQMTGTRVQANCATDPVDALACVSADRRTVWVLVWNVVERPDGPAYDTTVTLQLRGLPAGRLVCTRQAITPGHGDPLAMWQKLGSPPQLTAEQVGTLSAEAALRAAEPLAVGQPVGSRLTLELEAPGYGLQLLTFNLDLL